MEKKVFELFKDHKIYLVGGAVRDKLLDRLNKDLDFATSATPEQTKKIFQAAGLRIHDVGWAYGTVGAVIDSYVVQVTTFRKNENYQRHSRQPKVEWGRSIEEDLARRDFTINAMAMDSFGVIIDLFGGAEHINQHVIETPIDAEIAFRDDPLRMLRAVRFHSQLGFRFSPSVLKALQSQSYRILILPRERILEEFNKIICGKFVSQALEYLRLSKLLNYFIPELTNLEGIEQGAQFHHKNVWGHTIEVVNNSPEIIISRVAALFHDIGKPYTKTTDDVGRPQIHFYRHEEVSNFLTQSILTRMGYPKKWISDICFLVRNHMRPNLYDGSWGDTAVRRFIRDTSPLTDQLLALSRADITSHNPTAIETHVHQLEDLVERVKKLASFKEVKSPVDGRRLMEIFNVLQGPKVGKLKDQLITGLLEGEIQPGAEESVYVEYLKNRQRQGDK